MDPVRVGVTRKLINWALQQSSTQCAIAQALKDASDDFTHPRVDQNTISVTNTRTRQRYTFNTPERLATWIDDFDRDPTVCKPVSFTLDFDAPDKVRNVWRRSTERAVKDAAAYRDRNKKPARTFVNSKSTHRELRDVSI